MFVQINQCIFDLVMFQKPRALTSFFTDHCVCLAQNAQGAQSNVVRSPDRGRDNVEHWLFILLCLANAVNENPFPISSPHCPVYARRHRAPEHTRPKIDAIVIEPAPAANQTRVAPTAMPR